MVRADRPPNDPGRIRRSRTIWLRGKGLTRMRGMVLGLNAGGFSLVSGWRDTDRYGRKLRTVTRNGRSLGETLVEDGLARRWDAAERDWCSPPLTQ